MIHCPTNFIILLIFLCDALHISFMSQTLPHYFMFLFFPFWPATLESILKNRTPRHVQSSMGYNDPILFKNSPNSENLIGSADGSSLPSVDLTTLGFFSSLDHYLPHAFFLERRDSPFDQHEAVALRPLTYGLFILLLCYPCYSHYQQIKLPTSILANAHKISLRNFI